MADVPSAHPFRELRQRAHITLTFDPLAKLSGGAFYVRRGRRALIAVDPDIGRVERRVAIAHELGHEDLGDNESRVCDFVARWLCPETELAALVAAVCDDGSPVFAWEVAEAFDVTTEVAERACRLLRQKGQAAS